MDLKGVLKVFFLLVVFSLPAVSVMAEDVLTGDTKLACEAILCLSSGQTPDECEESLEKYFSIDHDDWDDTVDARKAFLRKCPSSENSDQQGQMNSLINSIAHGAGRCKAETLNVTQKDKRLIHVVEEVDRWFNPQACRDGCWVDGPKRYSVQIDVISDQAPDYCANYTNHDWTREVGVKYVGKRPPEEGYTIRGTKAQIQTKLEGLQGGHWENY